MTYKKIWQGLNEPCPHTTLHNTRLNTQSKFNQTEPVLGLEEMPNFSVPSLTVNTDTSHQQAEINRLTQVVQQWSTEVLHQCNQGPTHYNHNRINANTGRGRAIWPHSTPNLLPVPHNSRTSRWFDELEQQRFGSHDRRFQHHHRQEPDQRKCFHTSSNANSDSTSIMINALENFTAKISVQPLAQAALRSIQE